MKSNLQKELYERFSRYVKIDTQSDPNSKTFPSTKGQIVLGKILAEEMKKIGLKKVNIDKFKYVTAELPANTKKKTPNLAFFAHLDTSPDASGKNVEPKIHKNYNGKNITIKKGMTLSPKDSCDLLDCIGDDIVTSSGDTLLGGDNKAGISIILTAMNYLIKNPQIKHGNIKVMFTPDEELGISANHIDVKKLKTDYGYTIDSDGVGTVEDENFNADGVQIDIQGKAYHPGYAKGVMTNAARVAADIINSWPENKLPETTEKKEGYISFMNVTSSVEKAEIRGIARNHDIKKLKEQEKLLKAIIDAKKLKYPEAKITLTIKEQYRNMKQVLDKHPKVMQSLTQAVKAAGTEPKLKSIRGGTDGARLSFMGIPTPNVFMGGGNFHSRYEWVSLQGMEKSAKTVIELVQIWAK